MSKLPAAVPSTGHLIPHNLMLPNMMTRFTLTAALLLSGLVGSEARAQRRRAGIQPPDAAAVAQQLRQAAQGHFAALPPAVLSNARSVRDGRVFVAAYTIAADPAAPVRLRVEAAAILTRQLPAAGVHFRPEDAMQATAAEGCQVYVVDDEPRFDGSSAPPSDVRAQLMALAQHLEAAGTPTPVQVAGKCLRAAVDFPGRGLRSSSR